MRRRPTRRLVVLGGSCVLAVGCGGGDKTNGGGIAVDAMDIGHVHGLGENPSDGLLYVASHTGVYRIDPDGVPEQVAGRFQDTMAFTIVGPDRFLGSGHPDLRDDLPPQLGLIETNDAAETWSTLSLGGEADLHALVVAHEHVYAANATDGTVIVSSDGGSTWDVRGEAPLASLTVSPDSPDVLVGVTYDGEVIASDDGGRSWEPVTSAPPLLALTWHPDVGLVGLTGSGVVFLSDDGTAWEQAADLGGGEVAVATTEDGQLIAAAGGRYHRSSDGRTWAPGVGGET